MDNHKTDLTATFGILAGMYSRSKTNFKVFLSEGEQSFFNFEKKIICISSGIKANPEYGIKEHRYSEEEMEALLIHETGHVRFTNIGSGYDQKKEKCPFFIVNVLEDRRIDALQIKEFGSELLDQLRKVELEACFPLENPLRVMTQDGKVNGNNVLVLASHGERDRLDRVKKELSELNPRYEEFVEAAFDIGKTAVEAKSTQEIIKISKEFYSKWKEFFPENESNQPSGSEGSPENMGGKGDTTKEEKKVKEEEKQEEKEKQSQKDLKGGKSKGGPKPEELPKEKNKWFIWDEELILKESSRIKREMRMAAETTTSEFKTVGKRLSTQRLSVPTTKVFKAKEVIQGEVPVRASLVIDTSGSMLGEPYRNACHVARILKESQAFTELRVFLCGGSGLHMAGGDMKNMNQYPVGGDEQFERLLQTPDLIQPNGVMLFLTDACTGGESAKAIVSLAKKTKVVGGYVLKMDPTEAEDIKKEGNELFPAFIFHEHGVEGVGRVLARFLKKAVKHRGNFIYRQ
jgi:hypothetical protein